MIPNRDQPYLTATGDLWILQTYCDLEVIAQDRKITADQLADRIIPDCDTTRTALPS
jgi:hypothetical protein